MSYWLHHSNSCSNANSIPDINSKHFICLICLGATNENKQNSSCCFKEAFISTTTGRTDTLVSSIVLCLSSSDQTAMPKRLPAQTQSLKGTKRLAQEATDATGSPPPRKRPPTWRRRKRRREATTAITPPHLPNTTGTAPLSKGSTTQTSTRAPSTSPSPAPLLPLLRLLAGMFTTPSQAKTQVGTITTAIEARAKTKSGGSVTPT